MTIPAGTRKKVIQTTAGAAEFSVQYDENGMLTGSGVNEITARYIYDESGQLIRTNDRYAEDTLVYEYDSRGNMVSKKLYDYTTGNLNGLAPKETTTFTYANSGWKDQLVSVNGEELTYDENGNLRTYGEKTFSWYHGTRLESISDSQNTYSYVYDENGIRFSKTVNGETTQFNYVGGLLLSQKCGDEVIFFQYGAGGVPLGFVYNGVQYFYITNQLGDILEITDSNGDAFVMYSYDEWGKPIETITRNNTEEQNKIAEINPLRYRGYYYDTETGYYYLQSRYYNPEWGRFISPDSFSYIDNSTRIGFNAYIYCTNNPIMFIDPSGTKKTNNVGEVIFKSLAISIEIDSFTRLFEDIVQISDIDFNLNDWFTALPKPDKDLFSEMMLYLTTGFNDFFDGFWENLSQFSLKITLKQLIDNPLEELSNLPKLSLDVPAIKAAPIVGSISSIFSIFDDVNSGKLDTTQGIILGVYNIINLIVDFIPGFGSILSTFGDIFISISDIFFKYVNGEYI